MYQQSELDISIGAGLDAELFGFRLGGWSPGLSFSNMRGVDIQSSISAGISRNISGVQLSAGLTLGMNTNQEGATISPNVGLQYQNLSLGLGTKISSNEGIGNLAINANYKRQVNQNIEKVKEPDGQLVEETEPSTFHETKVVTFPLVMAKSPFIPKIDFPTSTISGSFHFRFGAEVWGLSPGAQVYGQFSKQSYPQKQRELAAFGYLYLQDKHDNDAIMDMAAEKESPIFEEDKDLSLSYLANDVFLVSAQGISETFRPFRTDIGISHNENQNSNDMGGSLGGEIHSGAYFHGGVDVTANLTSVYSGEWVDNNQLFSKLKFHKSNSNLPVYFKNVGETNFFKNEKNTFWTW